MGEGRDESERLIEFVPAPEANSVLFLPLSLASLNPVTGLWAARAGKGLGPGSPKNVVGPDICYRLQRWGKRIRPDYVRRMQTPGCVSHEQFAPFLE
jgi:hypothetical protein